MIESQVLAMQFAFFSIKETASIGQAIDTPVSEDYNCENSMV
jgi:hypothetical protein